MFSLAHSPLLRNRRLSLVYIADSRCRSALRVEESKGVSEVASDELRRCPQLMFTNFDVALCGRDVLVTSQCCPHFQADT
jgi:hypothetical protein